MGMRLTIEKGPLILVFQLCSQLSICVLLHMCTFNYTVRPLQINFLFPVCRPRAFDDLTKNSIIRTRKCRVLRSHERERTLVRTSVYD